MKNIISNLEINTMKLALQKIAIFGGFNDEQLYNIFSLLEEIKYNKGEVLFKEGDAPKNIFLILKGSVIFEGKGHKIIEYSEGDCIGEDFVISLQPYNIRAVAKEEVELVVISRKSLLNFYETDLELFSHLMMNISREISRKLEVTTDLLVESFEK